MSPKAPSLSRGDMSPQWDCGSRLRGRMKMHRYTFTAPLDHRCKPAEREWNEPLTITACHQGGRQIHDKRLCHAMQPVVLHK